MSNFLHTKPDWIPEESIAHLSLANNNKLVIQLAMGQKVQAA